MKSIKKEARPSADAESYLLSHGLPTALMLSLEEPVVLLQGTFFSLLLLAGTVQFCHHNNNLEASTASHQSHIGPHVLRQVQKCGWPSGMSRQTRTSCLLKEHEQISHKWTGRGVTDCNTCGDIPKRCRLPV